MRQIITTGDFVLLHGKPRQPPKPLAVCDHSS
jgi:hypothetical protein